MDENYLYVADTDSEDENDVEIQAVIQGEVVPINVDDSRDENADEDDFYITLDHDRIEVDNTDEELMNITPNNPEPGQVRPIVITPETNIDVTQSVANYEATNIPPLNEGVDTSAAATNDASLIRNIQPVRLQKTESSTAPHTATSSVLKTESREPDESGTKGASAACSDEESECCPICFEHFENSGDHRLASLKCGHLFGSSCIEKWLNSGKNIKCPQCNSPATKRDIRLIFAKKLKMVDTSDRDEARNNLDKERKLRQKLELESAQWRLSYQTALDECTKLREQLEQQQNTLNVLKKSSTVTGTFSESTSKANLPSSQTTSGSQRCASPGLSQSAATSGQHRASNKSGAFVLEKTIRLGDMANSRVMAYCPNISTLCISQFSINPLFPGFGVKKMNAIDLRTSNYIPLHKQMIRDVCVKPSDHKLLLSASMDKTMKLTNLASNSIVQSYTLPLAVWSCGFHLDDPNLLCAGLARGEVHIFDIRHTANSVQTFRTGFHSPVIALNYLQKIDNERPGGWLTCQLDLCCFYEFTPDVSVPGGQYKPHILKKDGSMCSISVDADTRHALLTYRPKQTCPRVQHHLVKLQALSANPLAAVSNEPMATSFELSPLRTFYGGGSQTHLIRNRLITHPTHDGNLLICSSDEATSSVLVWEATSALIGQKLPASEPILDLCAASNLEKFTLFGLAEKQLMVYQWQ